MKKKTKCYIYTRVSTAIQVDGYSLVAQKDKLRKYAEFQDMEIVGEYSDEGHSGKNIKGRQEFMRMLNDIEDGKDGVDFVLVFKLSRFGRNAADVLSSLQLMQDYGVNLICVEDGIDSSKEAGKLLISIIAAVAEMERENIRVQTMAGREQKAREGKWNGGFAPYGYKLENGELVIAEDSLDYPYADSVYITVMVPEEEYITQTENQSAMYAAIDAKKGEDKQVKEYIDKNVLKENDMINVFSVLDMKASFRRFVSKYYMIGSFLVVILAFIGIMNFFNTTATSVISRKKELALLEVVGMTKKQVSKMLVTEGFLYLGGAFVIAVLLVVFGAEKILANTLGTAFFFRLHLTIVPCVLMIPILVGIAYVIPKYQFEKMSRESIVERIRKE